MMSGSQNVKHTYQQIKIKLNNHNDL